VKRKEAAFVAGQAAVVVAVLALVSIPLGSTSNLSPLTRTLALTSTTFATVFGMNVQPLNATVSVPSSGEALVDFRVNSTVSGTFYFGAIPNSTIPVTAQVFFPGDTNAPFPIPYESLPAGLNASYPNGQVLAGTSQGVLAVELTAAPYTPSGIYTLYLYVLEQSGALGEPSAFPFMVDVTSG